MQQTTTSGETGLADIETKVHDPETIYVSTVVNPNAGNQIMTAHRSREGAEAQVAEMAELWHVDRGALHADVVPLPLLP
ncbi:hypothetical protein BH11ACT7_BH11ACT7_32620 [soil metagenome]